MSSGFITESEILEARRRRQEEWDKVRTEDQPKEAPEEEYDNRPLFQRLEEQRLRKDAEYEEAHKLKNMIRGLDDDEVGFLDLVERTKAEAAQQISMEEKKEMEQFRVYKSSLAEYDEISRLRAQLAPAKTPQAGQTQKNKLKGVVVRKRKAAEIEGEKDKEVSPKKIDVQNATVDQNGGIKCVGILPGLGQYDTDSTSDSDDSSDGPSSGEDEDEIVTDPLAETLDVDSASEADDDEGNDQQLHHLLGETEEDTVRSVPWSSDYSTFNATREEFEEEVGPKIEGTSQNTARSWIYSVVRPITWLRRKKRKRKVRKKVGNTKI